MRLGCYIQLFVGAENPGFPGQKILVFPLFLCVCAVLEELPFPGCCQAVLPAPSLLPRDV